MRFHQKYGPGRKQKTKMSKEKDNNLFSEFTFPIVKNVSAKLISDDLTPKTAEEVRKELGNVFKEILNKLNKLKEDE